MNPKDFTESQRQAVLDLLVLAMYADGHLASAEENRVQRWLTAQGYGTEANRDRQFDAAVTRVRPHTETAIKIAQYAITLARQFTSREHRRRVHDVLEDLLASDQQVAAPESAFLAAIKEQFQE